MRTITANSLLVLLLLSISCWATMVDLDCSEKKTVFRRSFCELMNLSDAAVLGRIVKQELLLSEKIEMPYTINEFPYNDSIYGVFTQKYQNTEKVYSQLRISIEYIYSNKKWKKIKTERNVYADEVRGWTWNGLEPADFNYHHPMELDDSLKVFFIRKTLHGDSLIGYSKSYKSVDSVQTKCFESRLSCKELMDGCYKWTKNVFSCKAYEPYTISEDDFYNDMEDFEFLLYGKIRSVSVRDFSISEDEIDFLKQSMYVLKDSLRNVFANAVSRKRRYNVIYNIEAISLYDGKWTNMNHQNMEIHSIQEQGFDWFLSPTLYKVEIDSLDSSNRVFRIAKHDDGTLHMIYVSKEERKLPRKKNRILYARKPNRSCLIE